MVGGRKFGPRSKAHLFMTAGSSIDYDALTLDAARGVVRAVLAEVAKFGLPGDHHFYIAFDTQAPGVVLSRRLREKYPEEMMIVLQHRFWDLKVSEHGFEVKLAFDGIPERLAVPFTAMRVFLDPSVRYSLQFASAGQPAPAKAGDSDGRGKRDAPAEPAGADGTVAGASQILHEGVTGQPRSTAGGPTVSELPNKAVPALVEARKTDVAAAGEATNGEDTGDGKTQEEEGKPAGGAKVLSLDEFRKKETR